MSDWVHMYMSVWFWGGKILGVHFLTAAAVACTFDVRSRVQARALDRSYTCAYVRDKHWLVIEFLHICKPWAWALRSITARLHLHARHFTHDSIACLLFRCHKLDTWRFMVGPANGGPYIVHVRLCMPLESCVRARTEKDKNKRVLPTKKTK